MTLIFFFFFLLINNFNPRLVGFKFAATQGFKSCQVIASDKSNLLRKVDFLLKSCFQVIAFLIPLEIGYLVIIVVNFVYK